jgi:hypothetical protein
LKFGEGEWMEKLRKLSHEEMKVEICFESLVNIDEVHWKFDETWVEVCGGCLKMNGIARLEVKVERV